MLSEKHRALFEAKFVKVDPRSCWNWLASTIGGGYGQFGEGKYAHRTSYELYKGPIPNGMHVLHRCDNRRCVNPRHLFLGTNDDNIRDKVAKGRQSGARGERSGKAKLTNDDVLEIRRRYVKWRANRSNAKQLAAEFGVCTAQIRAIVHRVQWTHI